MGKIDSSRRRRTMRQKMDNCEGLRQYALQLGEALGVNYRLEYDVDPAMSAAMEAMGIAIGSWYSTVTSIQMVARATCSVALTNQPPDWLFDNVIKSCHWDKLNPNAVFAVAYALGRWRP